jgi:hypothetical protein
MRVLVAVTLLMLAGCARQTVQPVSPVVGLEGPPAYKLRCPFESECLERAAQLCPAGFATLGSDYGAYGASKVIQCK